MSFLFGHYLPNSLDSVSVNAFSPPPSLLASLNRDVSNNLVASIQTELYVDLPVHALDKAHLRMLVYFEEGYVVL